MLIYPTVHYSLVSLLPCNQRRIYKMNYVLRLTMMLAFCVIIGSAMPSKKTTKSIGLPKYCRRSLSVSVCVQAPVYRLGKSIWCPFRLCGPRYVPAHYCPADSGQASHECRSVLVGGPVYKCLRGTKPKTFKLPIGCEATKSCKKTVKTCSCSWKHQEQQRYIATERVRPVCQPKKTP